MEPLIGHPRASTTEARPPSGRPGGIRSRYFFKTDWWLEIASSLLSVLCLLGMIILLGRIQNQPLSSWNSAVSPNAFISVLSTVSKACLIQPVSECISQLKWSYLLQSTRTKPPSILRLQDFDNASRGPLGSFQFLFRRPTRSMLPYISCLIVLGAIATDSFAQQILGFETRPVAVSGVYSELRSSQRLGWDNDGLYGLDRAILLTLYGEPQLPDLSCLGPLCQYPAFTSLGLTSNCQDVTELSKRNCTKADEDGYENCDFTTPRGFKLFRQAKINDTSSKVTGTSINEGSVIHEDNLKITMDAVLFKFGILRHPLNSFDPSDGMQIVECTLGLCAIEYTGWNISHGTIHPGLMNKYPVMTPNTTNFNIENRDYMIKINVSDPIFSYNRMFSVSVDWLYAISGLLNDKLIDHSVDDTFDMPLSGLIRSPNITEIVAGVANAVSYRMIGGPNATVTPVPVLNDEVVIVVRWAWISLPAVLVCASCLFLLVIIYRTNRAEHLVWKSSLTPLLLSQESYPVLRAGGKPLWTRSYLRARKAVIVNHLTK